MSYGRGTRFSACSQATDRTSLRLRHRRLHENLESAIPSLRLLQEELRQLRDMADHVLIDADNTEHEVDVLLGNQK